MDESEHLWRFTKLFRFLNRISIVKFSSIELFDLSISIRCYILHELRKEQRASERSSVDAD